MFCIKLAKCRVEYVYGQWCHTVFNDGCEWGAHPHDTPHYHVIAHRCGYGDDIWKYCIEHEACHAFLSEEGFFDSVVFVLAHDYKSCRPRRDATQEAMVQTFQRWLRSNERPIISGVNWDELKTRCLSLL